MGNRTMEEIRIINGKTVIYKPAGTSRTLSEAVIYYMAGLIPKGRVAVKEEMENFLAKKLGVHHIEIEPYLFDKVKYIDDVLELDRTYRFISVRGRVDKIYVHKLRAEGFEFEPATKYMVKVKNYKEFLFAYEKETNIDRAFIERINKTGYASLIELKGRID